MKQWKDGDDINGSKKVSAKAKPSKEFEVLRQRLAGFFNTRVQLTCSPKGKGKISIPFADEDELERIINLFDKLKE